MDVLSGSGDFGKLCHADVFQNQFPPIAPTNVVANPGKGVDPPNANQPLTVVKNADGSTRSVRGTVAGVTFNIG
jgi:hypothetical protein